MKFTSNFFHLIEKLNDLWHLTRALYNAALIWAAYEGQIEIVELLIRQKCIDINIQDIFNQKHS